MVHGVRRDAGGHAEVGVSPVTRNLITIGRCARAMASCRESTVPEDSRAPHEHPSTQPTSGMRPALNPVTFLPSVSKMIRYVLSEVASGLTIR